ncbi:MAG: hypothetical protein HYS17_10890 [Micavibrio aeruginosavorus]|uniref:Uncharacterized protein n=1 Tax=Micavibrio aeruginosavorus TaxID=349221 RepID=A0A7T5R1U2_9BACT|nr:MAG: hypothetical protein HYS17_10890 [Micavibrio aeruginosavorus]
MTVVQQGGTPVQFLRITWNQNHVYESECILKLDAKTIYNIAAYPLTTEPGTKAFFEELQQRGAILHDLEDEDGERIPAIRELAKEGGHLLAYCHYQDGKKQDPAPGKAASVSFASPDYTRIKSLTFFQNGCMQDPAVGEPAYQSFGSRGFTADTSEIIIHAESVVGGRNEKFTVVQLNALNTRKGLIAPALPPTMQKYVIKPAA